MTKRYTALLAAFSVLYLVLLFSAPVDQEVVDKYNLTESQLRLLLLTIALPLIGIWVVAFYGFINFKKYALRIKNRPDGQALSKVANGLLVLALSLPVSSLVSSSLTYLAENNEGLENSSVVINNYISIAFALAAFGLMAMGAMKLQEVLPEDKRQNMWSMSKVLGFVALGAVFTFIVFSNPDRRDAANGSGGYHLPDVLIALTIIVPYLVAWFAGLSSVLHINFYRKNVQGIIYKSSLKFLALGILTIVVTQVSLQFLTAAGPSFENLNLTPLLGIIYLLLAVISLGFLFIAKGAKKLNKIEES